MKKFLSLILALVMMMALALPAFAEEEEIFDVIDGNEFCNVFLRSYEAKINIKLENDIIGLDIVKAKPQVNRTINIDLNGHKLGISNFGINGKDTVFIYDNSEKPGTLNVKEVNVAGNLVVQDILLDLRNVKNYGIFYATGKSLDDIHLYVDKKSMSFIGKDIALEGVPKVMEDSLLILETDNIKDIELQSGANAPLGVLIHANLSGLTLDWDTFYSFARKASQLFFNKGPINLPTLGENFVKWVDKKGLDVSSVSKGSEVIVSALAKQSGTVKLDTNGGTYDNEEIKILSDGTLENELPTPERSGFCFTGWKLGNSVINNSTRYKNGDVIKAQWISITDKSSEITKALKGVGVSQTDIDKFLGLFKNNNVAGSIFIGNARPDKETFIPIPYAASTFNGPQATIVTALVIAAAGIAAGVYCMKGQKKEG